MKTKTKKKKIIFSALAAVTLVLPVSVMAVNKINSTQDTYAANVPSGFNDQNLYDCVLAEFQTEFPNESVASTGLTDTQLAKIKTIWCPGNDNRKIIDATGIEKMTAVTSITLNKNNLSSIDVSHNPNLIVLVLNENTIASLDVSNNPELLNLRAYGNQLSSLDISNNPKLEVLLIHNNPLASIDITNNPDLTEQFSVDDILVKANLEPISTTTAPSYSLSALNILGTGQSIENTSNYIYNSGNNSLIVSNYAGTGGYVQVSSSGAGKTFKLQMPKFLKFDANGGANNPSIVKCYSEAASGACSVTIPQGGPTRSGYVLKGYSDSSDAEEADYIIGNSVSLSEPKTIYAVWGDEDIDQDSTPVPDEEADADTNEEIDVPNSSGNTSETPVKVSNMSSKAPNASSKTPNTGEITKTDENNTANFIYTLPVLAVATIITLCICYKVKSRRKFRW